MTGTQSAYNQPTASQGKLGSSFVEFNADVPAQQASCITCHSYAQRQPTPPPAGSTPPGGPLPGGANVGTPTALPAAYKSLDFSWFLGFGVPQGSVCQDVNAGPLWNNGDAQAKCPSVCAKTSTTWNGQWKTTVQGQMSVCGCCSN
ncbi:MAG: mannan-binding lectin [Gammaproteobacteria bacterium]|nr:mannan-binding lectin [Gammaproteobacteria bacterium]